MHPQSTLPPNTRKKYGRNSSDEQHKMATMNSQVAAVDEWDRAHGGDPHPDDWYIDEGWSGFSMERPALDRLRDDAADPGRTWNELVVYDTSRLSREPGHRLYILEPELKDRGITITYVASPMYPDTADGRAMAGVQGIFDRWFAEKARETMRRGLRERVRAGVCWWAPYGYAVERTLDPATGRTHYAIVVVATEAQIVREVYAMVIAGQSCVQIARDLNARSVPTRKGARWSPQRIAAMIHARYYTGTAGFGKWLNVLPQRRRDDTITHRRRPKTSWQRRAEQEWLGQAAVPAIIEPATQAAAEEMLAQNKRLYARTPGQAYALRGLLRCALPHEDGTGPCGRTLSAHSRLRRSGARYSYYSCGRKRLAAGPQEPRTCQNHLLAEATDDLVWDAVIGALLRTEDLRAALAQLQDAPRRQRQQWEGAVARLLRQRERLRLQLRTQQRLLEDGTYSRAEYDIARADILPALEATERDLDHAQRSLAQVRAPRVDYSALEEQCALIARRAQSATREERAAVLAVLLTRIDVHADRLEIAGALGDITIATPHTTRHQLIHARPCR
jgi:site-specific DNA recombinase